MKKIILMMVGATLLSGCRIYSSYERPEELPLDSLYREPQATATDTTSLGDISWREMFSDGHLQELIEYGLDNNRDMLVSMLRVDQAKAQLKAAKLAFLPSLTFSPNGALNSTDGGKAVKTYELPVEASWEVDLFGNLRNAKKETQAELLQQQAYVQVVRSELIASIANGYYTLLMLDEQIDVSSATLNLWEEQVRTIASKLKVGEETENALTQAKASLYELQASHNDLLRQEREAENSLCTLLGMTSRDIERGKLDEQVFPQKINAGVPLRLLSKRPDVVQAEMELAGAYYSTNQAHSAFYPSLTLSGSAGWTNSLGQAVSNPGGWILSALASLSQPIFNRGKLVSNLRVSQDEEKVALLNYKQAILEAGQEVNDALYAVESVEKTLENHAKQCGELQRTVDIAEALYKTGNATYLEVLSAQQSLLNAKLNVITDTFTKCQSMVNLYTALGGGCE